MKFTVDLRDVHRHQKDLTLLAHDGPTLLGYIEFSSYHEEITVQTIKKLVDNKNVEAEMIKYLQWLYHDFEIIWGDITPEGEKLKNSLSYVEIENPEYRKYKKSLDKLNELDAKYIKISVTKKLTEKQKTELNEKWVTVHESIDKIEEILSKIKPSKRIIKI